MEQSKVIKEIREYHIIREIMKSKSVRRLVANRDPKVAGLIAIYDSYVQFFGNMRIDATETFDKFFTRLERNYTSTHDKVQPNDPGYLEYIKNVLGTKGLKTVTSVMSEEDNEKTINDLNRGIGLETGEANTIVVAQHIADYSVVSGLRGNLTEVTRKNSELEAELDRVRLVLGMTKENAKTKEEVLAKLALLETGILKSIVDGVAGNKILIEGLESSMGRSFTEIKTELAGVRADIGTVRTDISGVRTDIGLVRSDIASLASSVAASKKSTVKTIAITAGATFLATAALASGIFAIVANQMPQPVVSGDATNDTQYVEYLGDYNALTTQLKSLLNDNIFDEKDKTEFMASLDGFVQKYASSEKLADSSSQSAENLKAIANSVFGMSEEKIEAAKDLADANTNLTVLNQMIAKYDTNGDGSIADEIDALNKKVADLTKQLEEANSDEAIQALRVEIEGLQEDIKDLNKQITTLTGEKEDLIKENDDLKKSNAKLESDLNTANSNYQGLEKTILDAGKALDDLNTKVAAGTISEADYLTGVDKILTDLVKTGLADNIENLANQIVKLQADLKTAQDEYNDLLKKVEGDGGYEDQLAAAKDKIESLEQDIAGLTTDASALIMQIAEAYTGVAPASITEAIQAVKDFAKEMGITTSTPTTGNEKNPGTQPSLN